MGEINLFANFVTGSNNTFPNITFINIYACRSMVFFVLWILVFLIYRGYICCSFEKKFKK